MSKRTVLEQSVACKRAKTGDQTGDHTTDFLESFPYTDASFYKKIVQSLPYTDNAADTVLLTQHTDADTVLLTQHTDADTLPLTQHSDANTVFLTQSTQHTEMTLRVDDTDDEDEIEGWPNEDSLDIQHLSNDFKKLDLESEPFKHLTFMQQFIAEFYFKWYYKRFRDFSKEGARMDYDEMERFLCDLKCLQVKGTLICNSAKSLNAYVQKQQKSLESSMNHYKDTQGKVDLHQFFVDTHYLLHTYKKAFNVPNKKSWKKQLKKIN